MSLALVPQASQWSWAASPWVIVPALYAVVSIATFIAFGWDKWSAKKARPRVPESTLHLLELFGGWPGALAGQRWLRHKSEKLSYRLVLWVIIALHLAGWGAFAYLSANRA